MDLLLKQSLRLANLIIDADVDAIRAERERYAAKEKKSVEPIE